MVTVRSHYFYLSASQVVTPETDTDISNQTQFFLVEIPGIRNKTTI